MDISIDDAVAWIAQGGLLAYPTETVWGLGADARSDTAIGRLRAFKGRSGTAPVSILVTGVGALAALGFRVDAAAERLAREFWPGPLTLVLRCEAAFAAGLAREDGAVGVRCSPHAVANELAARCATAGTGPLTATSCNASGAPAAGTRAAARRVCGDDPHVRVISDGADAEGAASCAQRAQVSRSEPKASEDHQGGSRSEPKASEDHQGGSRSEPKASEDHQGGERRPSGLASTVVDVTGPRPRVLRWGAIAEPALRAVLEELAA